MKLFLATGFRLMLVFAIHLADSVAATRRRWRLGFMVLSKAQGDRPPVATGHLPVGEI